MKTKLRFLIIITVLSVFALALSACFGLSSDKDKTETVDRVPLTADMVSITGNHTYTGEPVTIDAKDISIIGNGRNIVLDSVTLTYENNIEVGTATLIVTAHADNKYVKGSVRVPFEITPVSQTVSVETEEEFLSLTDRVEYEALRVDCDITIAKNKTLVVGKDKRFYTGQKPDASAYDSTLTIRNEGTIRIEEGGTFYLGRAGVKTILINAGTIVIEGELNLDGGTEFYNSGTVTGSFKNYGSVYTNSPVNAVSQISGNVTVRKDLNSDQLVFVNPVSGKPITEPDGEIRFVNDDDRDDDEWRYFEDNKVRISVDGVFFNTADADYSGVDRAGMVTVTAIASETDKTFFGTYRGSYELKKGKTDVKDFADFAALQSSGNYNEYRVTHYGGFTIENVVIAANERLILTESATVISLTNYGTVSVEPRTVAGVGISGECNNYGEIVFPSSTIDGSGILRNGTSENHTASLSGKHLHVSSVVSYGEIFTESVNTGTRIENYGTLNTASFYTNSCRNEGSMTVGTFTVGARTNGEESEYVSGGNATLSISDDGAVHGNTFTVAGVCTIEKRIAFASNTTVTVTGRIENNGTVYAFRPIAGLTGAFVLRKNLTDEDVNVELEYYSVPYDGFSHKPLLTVDGEIIPTDNDYTKSISYLYDLEKTPKQDNTYTKVGSIFVGLTITDEYYPYYGYIRLTYEIEHATATVTSAAALTTAVNNENYNAIRLEEDIVAMSSITIVSGRTLDTNGYKLTITDYYSLTLNGGTLYVRPIEGKEGPDSVGLYVARTKNNTYKSYIRNNGTIENTGAILIDQWSAYTGENGVVRNEGTIYTHVGAPVPTSGDGIVYTRRMFTTGGDYTVELAYTETVYDGTDKEPSLTVTKNGEEMNLSDWSIVYENNRNAGSASVTIETPDPLDHDFYGSATYGFTILRATKEITVYNLNDNDFFDPLNYERYVQKMSIGNLRVPANVTLELNLVTYSHSGTIYLNEGARLEVTVDTLQELNDYLYGADKIIFGKNIGENTDTLNFNYTKPMSSSAKVSGGDLYASVLDLNGYSFGGKIVVYNTQDEHDIDVTILSSAEKSTIGYERSYALTQKLSSTPPRSETKITLSNLKIYGAEFAGGSNGRLLVNATGCDFLQVEKPSGAQGSQCNALSWARGFNSKGDPTDRSNGTFTDCTFTAFYSVVRIYGGNTTFNNCSFTSTADSYNEKTDYKGNAMTVCQPSNSDMYMTTVTVNGGTMAPINNGIAIEFYMTIEQGTVYTTITSTATVTRGYARKGW